MEHIAWKTLPVSIYIFIVKWVYDDRRYLNKVPPIYVIPGQWIGCSQAAILNAHARMDVIDRMIDGKRFVDSEQFICGILINLWLENRTMKYIYINICAAFKINPVLFSTTVTRMFTPLTHSQRHIHCMSTCLTIHCILNWPARVSLLLHNHITSDNLPLCPDYFRAMIVRYGLKIETQPSFILLIATWWHQTITRANVTYLFNHIPSSTFQWNSIRDQICVHL